MLSNSETPANKKSSATPPVAGNGANAAKSFDIHELLTALQAMRVGDFSVRFRSMPAASRARSPIRFNEIVAANQRMAKQLEGVGQGVGREGRTANACKLRASPIGAWGEMETSINTLIDDLLWPTTEVTRAIAAVAQGDLLQTVRLDVDGRPLQGEFLRSAYDRQYHDQAAQRVHVAK